MSLQSFIPTPQFSDYKEDFKDHYVLSRSEDGVIVAQAHTLGGPIQLNVENHRSISQLFKVIGGDPDNEIMIFTGTGPHFMASVDPDGFSLEAEDLEYWAYEYAYKDGCNNVSSLINDLEIPTIGAMNGPGFNAELCLMCDITICTEDTVIFDPHFAALGSVPGSGIHSCMQELLGVKPAAYALLTSEPINAQRALELGLVNEVVPRDHLLMRAKEIADDIMLLARTTRRLTTQIIRRPWKKRIVNDLDSGFGTHMFSHLANRVPIHTDINTEIDTEKQDSSKRSYKYYRKLLEAIDEAAKN
ncbi:enoyl-CoA hydratase/isomerase family protein [Maricurvus nonylphenolicus]|uniref:enoyl-CoA hydratase/isomerase family protein n=1 Tax=Maricurvus nonylphenolicus TaxID=1008307 RepID=UPI0036F2C371